MIDEITNYESSAIIAGKLASGIKNTGQFVLNNIGIVVKFREVDKQVQKYARRYNHGRARKVSFRRPSPQLSRERLRGIKQSVFLNAVLEGYQEGRR